VQLVAGANGPFVYMFHDIAAARLISELQPSVWVRSDKRGIQVSGAHCLSTQRRSQDGRTSHGAGRRGQVTPRSKTGSSFVSTTSLGWPRDQARVLRVQLKRDIDIHEAYVDRIYLNIYTGPGRTRIWIDDLEVAGFIGDEKNDGQATGSGAIRTPIVDREPASATLPAPRRDGPRLNGSILEISGRPFFPRVIEHQGEKLAFPQQRRIQLRAAENVGYAGNTRKKPLPPVFG